MSNIYGISNHSLTHVKNYLDSLQEDYNFNYCTLRPDKQKRFHTNQLYLAMNMQVLLNYMQVLSSKRGSLILFENPVILSGVSKIVLLDCTPQVSKHYKFEFNSLNKSDLIPVIKSVSNNKRIRIKYKELDMISELIKEEKIGKFLNKMNTLLYSNKNSTVQEETRKKLVEYLFKDLQLDKLEAFLCEKFTTKKSKTYITVVIEYFKSDKGLALHKGCQNMRNKNVVNYKDIADKEDTDSDELRYLHKLYLDS